MSAGITLVTGATGHLVANLIRRLLADGEQVRVMMRAERDNGALDGLDVERVFADLRNSEAVSAAVRGCASVYHCAALVSTIEGNAAHKREIFDTNVCGTINVLQAAERHSIDKLVVSGSLSATGYEPDRSSHEDMPFYPFERHLPYGFTKHLTEHECLKAHANGLNVVVAASCAIIGPHDYVPLRLGRVLIDYAHGSLRAYIPGGFEFVSSRDIAEGHVLAMRHGRSGQKYIFSTAYASVDDLMALMVLDNICDFSHAFLHRKYKPFIDAKLTRHEADDDRVYLTYDAYMAGGRISGIFVDRNRVNTRSIELCYEYPYQWTNTGDSIKNWSLMLPINERTTRVFFLFYFDALKIPLISMKTPKWLTQLVLNIAKPLVFKPILKEDGIALEAELLGYETYWESPPIELNPVVPMFQRLSARKWEEHLARKEAAQAACAD